MSWLNLPDWLPWWVPILVAVPLGLWLLSMLIMPFSVIGVKSRLESIEAELEELHADIRTIVLRLPEAGSGRLSYGAEPYQSPARPDRGYVVPEPPPRPAAAPARGQFTPPPPPAQPTRPYQDQPQSPRAEPRLDWRQR